MKKILWISRYVAYDTVRHAGGQNFNYYLKRMSKEDFDITMLSFCTREEMEKIDSERYGIKSCVYCMEEECSRFIQKIINVEMRYSPFNRHGNFCDQYIYKKVIKYVKFISQSESPNIIILHWTEIVLLASEIKRILPEAKLVAIEEDVAFLGLSRASKCTSSLFIKKLKELKYKKLKKQELKQLRNVDVIFTTNIKDKTLLEKHNLNDINVLSSYFQKYNYIKRANTFDYTALFYGAMNREENYKAAIWFIENVFPQIDKKWHFYIVGNNPHPDLCKYQSERIHITGFVESVEPYFEKNSCFVAPLITGAGIKIKILEAMSAGVPVLTNSIGIEGIKVECGKDYFYCSTADEYISTLTRIESKYELALTVGNNGKISVMKNFDYERSFDIFKKVIINISK